LKIAIIIPAHNEEAFIAKTLTSLVQQTHPAHQIIVVNDNATDRTEFIATAFQEHYKNIELINITSGTSHQPGSKVIRAFYKGFEQLTPDFDIVCKFDADLIFPKNYLATIATMFASNPKVGMASGLLHIQKGTHWSYENIAAKNHIRGPIKAYRKTCFTAIGGLRKSIGWDTTDVLLAQYHGWQTITDAELIVKHLKPTGKTYHKQAKYLQGEAMYKMRYGLVITLIAATKMAFQKKQFLLIYEYSKGYFSAKKKGLEFIVTEKEGHFIRNFRWKGILQRLR